VPGSRFLLSPFPLQLHFRQDFRFASAGLSILSVFLFADTWHLTHYSNTPGFHESTSSLVANPLKLCLLGGPSFSDYLEGSNIVACFHRLGVDSLKFHPTDVGFGACLLFSFSRKDMAQPHSLKKG
jgi:hypothetical protein